jgi:hypothetical protein
MRVCDDALVQSAASLAPEYSSSSSSSGSGGTGAEPVVAYATLHAQLARERENSRLLEKQLEALMAEQEELMETQMALQSHDTAAEARAGEATARAELQAVCAARDALQKTLDAERAAAAAAAAAAAQPPPPLAASTGGIESAVLLPPPPTPTANPTAPGDEMQAASKSELRRAFIVMRNELKALKSEVATARSDKRRLAAELASFRRQRFEDVKRERLLRTENEKLRLGRAATPGSSGLSGEPGAAGDPVRTAAAAAAAAAAEEPPATEVGPLTVPRTPASSGGGDLSVASPGGGGGGGLASTLSVAAALSSDAAAGSGGGVAVISARDRATRRETERLRGELAHARQQLEVARALAVEVGMKSAQELQQLRRCVAWAVGSMIAVHVCVCVCVCARDIA